ncbi:MAG TPA: hypothetical protein VL443_17890 [Cyclobacteriaceae bacterium]|nr:hypothetical protein [Cyclobacteriaceae bacterium]
MMPLKNVLIVNGVSSGATGIGLVAFAQLAAKLFDVSQTSVFAGTGIFLLVFAAVVLFEAFRDSIRMRQVQIIIALDVLWVIASVLVVLLMLSKISAIGNLLIIAVALWVAMMAFLQVKGLKQISI